MKHKKMAAIIGGGIAGVGIGYLAGKFIDRHDVDGDSGTEDRDELEARSDALAVDREDAFVPEAMVTDPDAHVTV